MEIQLLPEHIIDQIKAGEVIDSPAGIIKELIENAIDAEASRVEVHLVNNGLELISIKDNGKGIGFGDLPLAFARHATSKIEKFEDLYRCSSFGFRGEALASLASVAKVTCQSSTTKEKGQKIIFEGGKLLLHEKVSRDLPIGTEIFVKDLFFNTPARFKFLTSQAGEKSRIKKILNYYLISHPQVNFSIKWDDQDKIIYPEMNQIERFQKVTKTTEEELIKLENQYEDLFVEGVISKKEKSRPLQFCYVNKRPIEDERIRNTLNHTLLSYGFSRKQDWIINLEIPFNKIDVNVHPKKTRIKFFQPSVVYSLISNSLKHYFQNRKIETQAQIYEPISKPIEEYQKPIKDPSNQVKNTFIGSQVNFAQTRSSLSYLKNKSGILLNFEERFWGISKQELAKKVLHYIQNNTQEITPLLVATPLEMKQLRPMTLSLLQELQIETQAIEENYWVVKSLPTILADFSGSALNNFILILEQNLNFQEAFESLINEVEQTSIEVLFKKDFFKLVHLNKL